jgi:hypothetical protein
MISLSCHLLQNSPKQSGQAEHKSRGKKEKNENKLERVRKLKLEQMDHYLDPMNKINLGKCLAILNKWAMIKAE